MMMTNDNPCPKCKTDDAWGKMGTIWICLNCGYEEK